MEKSIEALEDLFHEAFQVELSEAGQYSPLVLAYIGDAVYELIIRSILLGRGNAPVNKLHQRASRLVKASAQAEAVYNIMDILHDDELAAFKRGRNAKSHTVAKNAEVGDYRAATGFEALMGYLYIKKEYGRLIELVKLGAGGVLGLVPEKAADSCEE